MIGAWTTSSLKRAPRNYYTFWNQLKMNLIKYSIVN